MSVCGCLGGRTKFHFVMKKKNILWLIAFALLMPLFALTACSDDDDDDNDSTGDKTEQTTNDGTKVLNKKVTKIVETYSEGGKYEEVETYIFDTDGRLISSTEVENYDNHDVETKIYTYNDNTIIREKTKNNRLESRYVLNIDNGRVVSEEFAVGDDLEYVYLTEYTYLDGYLASYTEGHKSPDSDGTHNSKQTYSVNNENITGVDYEDIDDYGESIYKYHSERNIVYDSKLNNLNVDLCLFLLGDDLDVLPLTGYYGKRIKNLPLTISKKSTDEHTYNSETTTETSASVYNFTYTYDGDYPTKIVREKVGSYTYTYEIFYNE